jgi:hypothetical protein
MSFERNLSNVLVFINGKLNSKYLNTHQREVLVLLRSVKKHIVSKDVIVQPLHAMIDSGSFDAYYPEKKALGRSEKQMILYHDLDAAFDEQKRAIVVYVDEGLSPYVFALKVIHECVHIIRVYFNSDSRESSLMKAWRNQTFIEEEPIRHARITAREEQLSFWVENVLSNSKKERSTAIPNSIKTVKEKEYEELEGIDISGMFHSSESLKKLIVHIL